METKSTMAATNVYEFNVEPVANVLEDQELLHEHRAAVPMFQTGRFQLDRGFYSEAEEAGCLHTPTLRHDGRLVGYSFVFCKLGHHHSGSDATVDAFYIKPEHSARMTTKFVAFMDEYFTDLGITDIYHLVPSARDWGLILERQGFPSRS